MATRRSRELFEQYWRAQARLGLDVRTRALSAWPMVNPRALPLTGRMWLDLVLAAIRSSREPSRRRARAFYRLYRAYETYSTVTLPGREPGRTTLGDLRREWLYEIEEEFVPDDRDHDEIPEEPIDWPEPDDERADRAAIVSLVATGPGRVQQLVDELEEQIRRDEERDRTHLDDRPAEPRRRLDDPEFLAALDRAGRSAANVTDYEASRAGRDLLDRVSRGDRRVRGWARVTDGNPCAFCAMLASRGAVYRSHQSAGTTGDPRPDSMEGLTKYHPGCHCQTVPVYSREDHVTAESRRLAEEWSTVTRGHVGDDARRVWRRHIEAQQRQRRRADNDRLLRRAREA